MLLEAQNSAFLDDKCAADMLPRPVHGALRTTHCTLITIESSITIHRGDGALRSISRSDFYK